MLGAFSVAVKEILSRYEQCFDGFEQLTMGDFPTKVPPEHFYRVEPGTISRQIEQDQPSGGAADNSFNLIVFMGTGVIPSDINCFQWMLIQDRLEQFCHFTAALVLAEDDQCFACVIIDCS